MTDDRLSELRDLLADAIRKSDQLRQEQLKLLPAARASKASTTAIADALGISRAAFYKKGHHQPRTAGKGDPARATQLLESLGLLQEERDVLGERIISWRQERDQTILTELSGEEKPKWTELSTRAGVSEEWISRVRSGKSRRGN